MGSNPLEDMCVFFLILARRGHFCSLNSSRDKPSDHSEAIFLSGVRDWLQTINNNHADPPSLGNLSRKESISEFTVPASSCWTKWCPSMIEISRSGTFSFRAPLLTYFSVPKDCRPTSFLLSMNFAGTVIFDPLQGAVSLQFLQVTEGYQYQVMGIQQTASVREEGRRCGNYVSSMR